MFFNGSFAHLPGKTNSCPILWKLATFIGASVFTKIRDNCNIEVFLCSNRKKFKKK